MFCSQCGFENSDENNFCEKCGSPLKVIPDQPRGQQPPPYYAQPVPTQPSPGAEAFKKSFTVLKSIFSKPASTAESLSEPNGIISGLVYMGIKCLVVLIIAIILAQDVPEQVKIGRVYFYLIVMTIGINCLEAVLIRAFGSVFKLELDMKKSFVSVGVASFFSAILWLACAILIYLLPTFGIIITVITISIPAIMTLGIICHLSKGDTNKKIWMYVIVRVLTLLAMIIVTYLLARSYVGELKEMIPMDYLNFI